LNEVRAGCLFIISGPSGVGKSTLVQRLIHEQTSLKFSISCTTRPRRPQEVEGVHYFFVDEATFESMLSEDAFIEHARYNDNWYGTPIAPLREWVEQGHKVILEIEVQGATQLREQQDQLGIPMCFVFILPPSFEHLKQRIDHRGTESEAKREKRLQIAEQELQHADSFDIQIVNMDIEHAYQELCDVVANN
jgi:guanylate kinase